MAGAPNDSFIRIPPDGAGKRILHGHIIHLDYTAAVGNFIRGTDVSGAVSGLAGLVVHVNEFTGSTGAITILTAADTNSDHHDKYFTTNEDLLVDGVPIAKAVDGGQDIYINKTLLAGGNNPYYLQQVDARGAASVRFAEGSFIFDAAGRSQISSPVILADHSYTYDDNGFTPILTAGGTITYNAADAAVVLTCTSASGDGALRRTDNVFKTVPGGSMAARMGIRVGDTGKENVVRRWGMFSNEEGIYWELNGSQLQVVRRETDGGAATPSITEFAVQQADFNVDRLDGTGPSRIALHPEYPNLYWIDYQWAGGARVRFGIFGPEGRIVAHIMDAFNQGVAPVFRTGSFPMSMEQENTGAAASTSEMSVYASSVVSDGAPVPVQGFGGIPFGPVTVGGADYSVIGSFRPALTYNGRRNNGVVLITGLVVTAMSEDWTSEIPVSLAAGIDHPLYGGLTNPVWGASSPLPGSSSVMEIDRSATGWAGVFPPFEMYYVKGVQTITLGAADYASGFKLGLSADNQQLGVVLLAKCMNPAGTGKVSIIVNWTEVLD